MCEPIGSFGLASPHIDPPKRLKVGSIGLAGASQHRLHHRIPERLSEFRGQCLDEGDQTGVVDPAHDGVGAGKPLIPMHNPGPLRGEGRDPQQALVVG